MEQTLSITARTAAATCGAERVEGVPKLSPEGELDGSSAGHGPTFLRPHCHEPVEVLDPPVQPLGVTSRWFDGAPGRVRLHETGSLTLISDGIFEAMNDRDEQFGTERLVKVLDAQPHTCRPEEIIAAIRQAVRDWQGTLEPHDDQTIVVVQRT